MITLTLENGDTHVLTKDELKILRIAIRDFHRDDYFLFCTEERNLVLEKAHEELKKLFV